MQRSLSLEEEVEIRTRAKTTRRSFLLASGATATIGVLFPSLAFGSDNAKAELNLPYMYERFNRPWLAEKMIRVELPSELLSTIEALPYRRKYDIGEFPDKVMRETHHHANHPIDSVLIEQILPQIDEMRERHAIPEEHELGMMAVLAAKIKYEPDRRKIHRPGWFRFDDIVYTEDVQFATETFFRGKGDCDDICCLLAGLTAQRYDTAFLQINGPPTPQGENTRRANGHLVVLVKDPLDRGTARFDGYSPLFAITNSHIPVPVIGELLDRHKRMAYEHGYVINKVVPEPHFLIDPELSLIRYDTNLIDSSVCVVNLGTSLGKCQLEYDVHSNGTERIQTGTQFSLPVNQYAKIRSRVGMTRDSSALTIKAKPGGHRGSTVSYALRT